MKNHKSLYLTLILLSLLVLPLVNTPLGKAAASNPREKALSFLADVVSIDVGKYNVTLVSDGSPYNVVNSADQEEVRYKLENSKNTLDVTCLFKNNALVWCTIYVLSGSPVYTQTPSTNLLDQVSTLLDRYQNYTSSSRYQGMKSMLSLLQTADDTAAILGDAKLVIHSDGVAKGFEWTYIYNGVEAPGLQIEFFNGILETFNDQASLFTIGSTTTNISKEKAIDIALDRVKDFSWTVGLDPSTAIEVTNFTVLSENAQIKLSMQPREDSTLYPFWRVDLYLDKVYAGGVSSIAVGIWADTGEISYCKALSYGGDLPPNNTTTENTSTLPATSTQEPTISPSTQIVNNTTPSLNISLAAGAVAIIAMIVLAAVLFKKRSK